MKNLEKYLTLLGEEVDGLLLTSRYSRHYGAEFDIAEGVAIVSKAGCRYFTDSRYIESAQNGINGFEVICVDKIGYNKLLNDARLYYKPDGTNDSALVSSAQAVVQIPGLFRKELTHDFDGYTASYKVTINEAKLVLTNDTGPMHIAAKYGVKTICITGGWHWGVFAPCKEYKSVKFIYEKMPCYGCGGSCKYKTIPFKCLQKLLS